MVSSKSSLYRLSVDVITIAQVLEFHKGIPMNSVRKNHTKTELWKLVISHNSAFCAILLFKILIQKFNPVRTAPGH